MFASRVIVTVSTTEGPYDDTVWVRHRVGLRGLAGNSPELLSWVRDNRMPRDTALRLDREHRGYFRVWAVPVDL